MADVELDVTFESSNVSLNTDFGSVYVIDGNTAVKVIANKYSNTNTYSVGAYVIYDGLLYRCTTEIDTPEEFDSEKWLNIKLADDVKSVKSALDTLSGVVDGKANSADVTSALANKMNKTDPTGSGSLSLNRKPGDIGSRSVTVGDGNTASGPTSFAAGRSTIANHRSQHVFGEYNTPDDSTVSINGRGNYIEIIGNGTGIRERSNARTLDWSGNETIAGDLTYNGDKSLTSEISRLDGRITDLPEAMVFKGTLGVGGTIETLPTASAENEGWMFKCITEGTYAGLELKVGDTVTCFNPPNTSVYEWEKTGSQDTDTDTWRNIKVNGVEKLGNGISSGAVDFEDTANVKFEFDADGNKVRAKLEGIYTESDVDDLLDDKADADNTYTKAQVDDIVYGILPDDTASGSIANFETDLALPVKSLEIDVNAKQDLHGYDYPWTAGGGKNLFAPYTERTSNNGINYSVNSNGTIRCQGTSTGASYSGSNLNYANAPILLKAGTYTISANGFSATGGAQGYLSFGARYSDETLVQSSSIRNNSATITLEEDAHCFYWIYVANNRTINEDIAIQVEAGSTATEWTPYENICPIEGWSEISLYHRGANLFNKATVINGYYIADTDGIAKPDANSKCTDFIEVKGGATYAIMTEQTSGGWGAWYDKNKNFISAITGYAKATPTTYTAPSNAFFARLTCYRAGVGNIDTFAFNTPRTATTYEPYAGTTEVINLGGTYYGGHVSQDKDGHRQFEVTCAKEHISLQGKTYDTANGFDAWLVYLTNRSLNAGSSANKLCSVCNNYRYEGSSANIEHYYIASQAVVIYLAENTFRDGEFDIVYPLATPYVIDLPDGEPINTLIGTNNIFADTGDTNVVFKDSVNGYVEKKIASVQALALNT